MPINKKILLASISKTFLERNKNLLSREDFLLLTTNNGAEALELHRQHRFDLVIADLYLKDMGGDLLCAQLHGEGGDRPVAVVLICFDKADEHVRVAQSGADAKIIRPVLPEQIIETVGNLLGIPLGRPKRAIFKVRVQSRKGVLAFVCVSLDISVTGMLLQTEHHLDIGDRIVCQFTLPGAGSIETEGDVVRSVSPASGEHQYGIQFIALPLASRREVERYIASVSGKPDKH